MADRPLIQARPIFPLVKNGDMSANIISPPTNINMLPGLSYDLQWTGAPVGTFSVQVSNSYSQNPDGSVQTPGQWSTLLPSSFQGTYPVPAGSPGNGFLDIVGTEAAWIRLVYNFTSGTGSLTVIPAAKVW